VRGVAVVTRVTHRVFGAQQWRDLRASIECWRDNMAGVREAVAKSAEARGKESAPIAAH
jgi:translation initiation factor 3 subunit M